MWHQQMIYSGSRITIPTTNVQVHVSRVVRVLHQSTLVCLWSNAWTQLLVVSLLYKYEMMQQNVFDNCTTVKLLVFTVRPETVVMAAGVTMVLMLSMDSQPGFYFLK